MTASQEPAENPQGIDIANATVAKVAAKTYTGKVLEPSLTVTYAGKALQKDVDYTLSYKNNKKRGTATVVVIGKGSFKGKRIVKFTIK